MAVSPKILEEEYQLRLKAFEANIDSSLLKRKNESINEIFIDPQSQMNSKDWEYLRPRYIEAGWKEAEYHSEQREGGWLTLKA